MKKLEKLFFLWISSFSSWLNSKIWYSPITVNCLFDFYFSRPESCDRPTILTQNSLVYLRKTKKAVTETNLSVSVIDEKTRWVYTSQSGSSWCFSYSSNCVTGVPRKKLVIFAFEENEIFFWVPLVELFKFLGNPRQPVFSHEI